jgi:DNA (cytosine-5)-methyltransferase 1
MKNIKLKGLSLFSSAGVAELNLNKYINFVAANEILKIRAKVHEYWHPKTEMIYGDVTISSIKESIISKSISKGVNFILATPPCQGVSLIGKNKRNSQFLNDMRNFLIFHALEIVDKVKPNIVVIENVERFAKMFFPYENGMYCLNDILKMKYNGIYNIDFQIYNAADFGVPQARKRLVVVLYKNGYKYITPKKVKKHVSVEEAIGNLPSMESGEITNIKHHNARVHTKDHIKFMQHTPTGKSAFQNNKYFPKKRDGSRITGYPYTYKRIDWNRPAPTITMRSDAISSTHTVHPGRLLTNGLYSDARVLSLRELFVLTSIDPEIDLPDFLSDSQLRHIIGEAVPPLLMEKICKNIKKIK